MRVSLNKPERKHAIANYPLATPSRMRPETVCTALHVSRGLLLFNTTCILTGPPITRASTCIAMDGLPGGRDYGGTHELSMRGDSPDAANGRHAPAALARKCGCSCGCCEQRSYWYS